MAIFYTKCSLDSRVIRNLFEADFCEAEIDSIYVYDEFDTKTHAVLFGKEARQWLFSRGAKVNNPEELNPLLGKPWYKAAREVTKTLEQRIAGTHQDNSLSKGTDLRDREFASAFVNHLRNKGVLVDVKKSKRGSMIVRVASGQRDVIRRFNDDGVIDTVLESFFEKFS